MQRAELVLETVVFYFLTTIFLIIFNQQNPHHLMLSNPGGMMAVEATKITKSERTIGKHRLIL
jgi:hypothetical protein